MAFASALAEAVGSETGGLEEGGFRKGDRVKTPLGPGQVNYQRMEPPDYSKPMAVSVILDKKQNKPGYSGTVFKAKDVKPLKEGEDPDELDTMFAEAVGELVERKAGKEAIDQMREIVKEKQYRKVQGYVVDLFTASHVVQVYDALSPANQKKLESLPLPRMIDLVWKLVKKVS